MNINNKSCHETVLETWQMCSNNNDNFVYEGGVIMMILYFIIIAFSIYYILKISDKSNKTSKKNSNDILDIRLAKGEITIEEYSKIKKELGE